MSPSNCAKKFMLGFFVELSCLLPDNAMDYDYDGEPRRLKRHSLPSLDFFDFTAAFLILTAIRFPSEGMLKHLETVRAMHKTYGDDAWLQYDRQFRWAMQFDPSQSWGRPSVELYMTASERVLFEEVNCKFLDTHGCYTCQGPHATSDCTLAEAKSEILSASSAKGESGQPVRSRGLACASCSHVEPLDD
jgi:hypothetical protein